MYLSFLPSPISTTDFIPLQRPPNTLFLSPPPIVTEKDLHWLVVVVGWGGRVLLTLHSPLCSPHSCLLCCLLDVRVLPSAGGPFFLSLAHAAPAATVEVVNLAQNNILLLKSCPFIAQKITCPNQATRCLLSLTKSEYIWIYLIYRLLSFKHQLCNKISTLLRNPKKNRQLSAFRG